MKPSKRFHYILLNKPHGVVCQFTDAGGRPTLGDFGRFPKDVYAAGRLDFDSEGLLLLTNDGTLKHNLLEPKYRHARTYLVQVERVPSPEALQRLRDGVILDGRKTLAAEVRLLDNEPDIPPRPVLIRFRKNVPTAWLNMTLFEGRNRQVRRMTAAVGFPTLRIFRTHIGNLSLGGLQPGQHRSLTPQEISSLRAMLRG